MCVVVFKWATGFVYLGYKESMDLMQQVQVTCDSYCGANLLSHLPVKDSSVVGWKFFPYVSFVVCHLSFL